MIKGKCQLCTERKAKRICNLKEMAQICPPCCATMRNEFCEGCSYYSAAAKYEKEQQKRKRHFTTILDLEIDEACDKALLLVEKGKIVEGEDILRELDRKHPRYHTVKYGLGVCRIASDRMEDAIAYFKEAILIFPYFIEAHYNMAAAYRKLWKIEEAVDAYRKVIQIGSDKELVAKAKRFMDGLEKSVERESGMDVDSFIKNMRTFDKAYIAMKAGRYDLAIDLFNLVLTRDPENVPSWGNLGLAYACKGERTRALECLDKALEIDPYYELAMVNKVLLEKAKEGERIDFNGESVDYYKDYGKERNRSYLSEMINSFRK